MKKQNEYQTLNLSELRAKQKEFVNELVKSRLTMDTATFTSATNLQNLKRGLKTVSRLVAQNEKANLSKEVGQ